MDVTVVNGKICGFEIKSDVDRLTRLRAQEPAFSAVCDEVCLVTTSRHLKSSRSSIPSWWGIVVARSSEDGVIFEERRSPKKNKQSNNEALLYMLNRAELKQVLREAGMSRMRQSELIDAIIQRISSDDLRSRARDALKRRATYAYSSSPPPLKNSITPGA
jgi:hypothetical protein